MKLKLIFPYPGWKEVSNKYSITIYRNKIHNYTGRHPLRTNFPNAPKQETSEKFINSIFSISKLDKLDREDLSTNATHKIDSPELHRIVYACEPYCVKLNLFQELYINWFQNKYIIQSLDFKKSILTGFCGAIIGSLVTMGFKNKPRTNKAPIASIKQEKQNDFEQKHIQVDKRLKSDSVKREN